MKRILIFTMILCIAVTCISGCATKENNIKDTTQLTVEEQIREVYSDVISAVNSDDNAEVRKNLEKLTEIYNDSNNSEMDRKTARCIYCFITGVYKLGVSGKGVSGLQYPELLVLEQNVPVYLSGEKIPEIDYTLELAETFLSAVNEEVR